MLQNKEDGDLISVNTSMFGSIINVVPTSGNGLIQLVSFMAYQLDL